MRDDLMMRFPISALLLCLVAGCLQKGNPYYCGGRNPDNNCQEEQVHSCTMNADCPLGTPVCDLQSKICVQCTDTEQMACRDTTPICRADEHCHGCKLHGECPITSNACLPTGECANPDKVAYVDAGARTDNSMCTKAMPCKSIMTAIATHQPYIKLSGTFDEAVNINTPSDSTVMILADAGTSLTRSGGGNILVVDSSSKVEIYDLAINGASDPGAGVSLSPGSTQTVKLGHVSMSGNNGRLGAIAVFGGTIIINRSVISSNRGGGISIAMANFDIENNFIIGNGSDQSMTGGISLDKIDAGTRILNFNTISANRSSTGMNVVPGVSCTPSVSLNAPFSSNIVYGNGTSSTAAQVDTDHCSWTYSDVGPGEASHGTKNVSMDPQFMDSPPGNFHLKPGSPLIDAADPDAKQQDDLSFDIDGDARPQGARRDIGADEYKALPSARKATPAHTLRRAASASSAGSSSASSASSSAGPRDSSSKPRH